jgi:hypothetical protein
MNNVCGLSLIFLFVSVFNIVTKDGLGHGYWIADFWTLQKPAIRGCDVLGDIWGCKLFLPLIKHQHHNIL